MILIQPMPPRRAGVILLKLKNAMLVSTPRSTFPIAAPAKSTPRWCTDLSFRHKYQP